MRRSLLKNESAYTGKSKQRHKKTLSNFLLHVANHALKDLYMLNHANIIRIVSIIVPLIKVIKSRYKQCGAKMY